jgi:glycerophosphoryl diester phosphodiesterase
LPSSRDGWLRGVTYAHRGLHGGGRIDNSTGAFAAAIAAGLGIECDVQLTADHRALVFHDWELDRLTGESGPVSARTVAELSPVALRGSGEPIPTLRDLLEQIAGQVPLLVELKSKADRSPTALCRAVARDLEGYGGRAAVMSFDPRVGQWFAAHAPHVVRGLVVTEENARTFSGTVRRRLWLRRSQAQFLAYDVRDLPSRFAAAQRAKGLPVLTWTVSTPALRQRALEHADGWIAEAEGVATAVASA